LRENNETFAIERRNGINSELFSIPIFVFFNVLINCGVNDFGDGGHNLMSGDHAINTNASLEAQRRCALSVIIKTILMRNMQKCIFAIAAFAEFAADSAILWHIPTAIPATTATRFPDFLPQMATMAAAQTISATANAATKNHVRRQQPQQQQL
jgi:hypothetical protein